MKFKPFSKKQLATLCWWGPNSPYRDKDAVICDGAVRSGKSLCMFVSFITWAGCSFQNASFAICGRTQSSVRRNLITPYLPVLEGLGAKCQYKMSQNKLTVEMNGRENTFWIFGGKDEASAALIQGMTLAGVMFDEVALMPRSFVEQALARCSIEGSKFWFNCNPSNPSHWFYNEWIKKADSKNALYLHFTMSENPSLSREMLERYENMYSGAFYERFVKGRWVAADGIVYPMFGNRCMADCPEQCTRYYGISCDGKRAVQLKKSDYEKYDMFIAMDSNNIRNIGRIFGSDPDMKVHKMMDFTDRKGDVADPWYSGRFDVAYKDIFDGCAGLLDTFSR